MTAHHEVETVAWKGRTPSVYRAQCTCSWKGPPRTGRNAQALAAADGKDHAAGAQSSAEGPAETRRRPFGRRL